MINGEVEVQVLVEIILMIGSTTNNKVVILLHREKW
jgi:hypothetical protein